MGNSAIEAVPALGGGGGAVSSVNTRTGAVVLTAADVGAGQLPAGVLLDSGIIIPSGADISGILGTSGSKAAAGNDARLSDARTPTAHKTSHEPGGTDALTLLDNTSIKAAAGIALSKLATDPLARANHTGTQTVSTLSDYAASDPAAGTAGLRTLGLTGTKAMPGTATLDQIANPAAARDMGSQKLTNLANGSGAQDGAAFGQIPISGGVGGLSKIVRRSGDSSPVTANITPANDDTLLWAIGASDVWEGEATIIATGNTAMDILFGWTVPASATMSWGIAGSGAVTGWAGQATAGTPSALLTAAQTLAVGMNTGPVGMVLKFIVVGGGTGGNVNLKWSQNTSDAGSLVIKANSFLKLTRLA